MQVPETAMGIGVIQEDRENAGQLSSLQHSANPGQKKLLSGSITLNGDSGPLQYRPKKEMMNTSTGLVVGDDTSDGAIVQRKGRFQVTSADISPKGPVNSVFNSLLGGSSTSSTTSALPAAPILTSLRCILHQNTMQREEMVKLMKYVEHSSGPMELAENFNDLQISSTTAKERELQSQAIQLQNSVENLAEELQRQKLENAKLEKKLNTLLNRDESA